MIANQDLVEWMEAQQAFLVLEAYMQRHGAVNVVGWMSESTKQQLWVALSGPNEPEMD